MNRDDINKLIDRWVNEPDFRKQVRSDPVETLKESGCQLTAGEIEAIGQLDWSLSDEELKSRVSKGM